MEINLAEITDKKLYEVGAITVGQLAQLIAKELHIMQNETPPEYVDSEEAFKILDIKNRSYFQSILGWAELNKFEVRKRGYSYNREDLQRLSKEVWERYPNMRLLRDEVKRMRKPN